MVDSFIHSFIHSSIHSSIPSSTHPPTYTQVKDEKSGECHRADKLLEDFIDKYLEENPTFTREQQEEHRRVQRQADAYTPEQLHELFQVGGREWVVEWVVWVDGRL